jgi:hypothetical protein
MILVDEKSLIAFALEGLGPQVGQQDRAPQTSFFCLVWTGYFLELIGMYSNEEKEENWLVVGLACC